MHCFAVTYHCLGTITVGFTSAMASCTWSRTISGYLEERGCMRGGAGWGEQGPFGSAWSWYTLVPRSWFVATLENGRGRDVYDGARGVACIGWLRSCTLLSYVSAAGHDDVVNTSGRRGENYEMYRNDLVRCRCSPSPIAEVGGRRLSGLQSSTLYANGEQVPESISQTIRF